jgi:hypothetical protein
MDARTKLLLLICSAAVVVTVHAAVGELLSRSCGLLKDGPPPCCYLVTACLTHSLCASIERTFSLALLHNTGRVGYHK